MSALLNQGTGVHCIRHAFHSSLDHRSDVVTVLCAEQLLHRLQLLQHIIPQQVAPV